jgi:hypothetical protein
MELREDKARPDMMFDGKDKVCELEFCILQVQE